MIIQESKNHIAVEKTGHQKGSNKLETRAFGYNIKKFPVTTQNTIKVRLKQKVIIPRKCTIENNSKVSHLILKINHSQRKYG